VTPGWLRTAAPRRAWRVRDDAVLQILRHRVASASTRRRGGGPASALLRAATAQRTTVRSSPASRASALPARLIQVRRRTKQPAWRDGHAVSLQEMTDERFCRPFGDPGEDDGGFGRASQFQFRMVREKAPQPRAVASCARPHEPPGDSGARRRVRLAVGRRRADVVDEVTHASTARRSRAPR
jgi:hypothetical protein